ncbi:hypothetical protein F5I97DRAFT_1913686 [Phlebopus sp. FC_14]|nr:hypothetical protein F5I97DRAFT_1913686 [Phlebopus sp. FC_14]
MQGTSLILEFETWGLVGGNHLATPTKQPARIFKLDATMTSTDDSQSDPRVHTTLNTVNWKAILQTVCKNADKPTDLCHWKGEPVSGGFNLIRFLRLDDQEVVVRVPLYPDPETTGPMTPEIMNQNVRNMASMLTSMEYVATYSSIPVPRIIYSCLDPELNNVRSPYVVMSKVDGVLLCTVWNEMPDDQREIVLRQVIDILLELSTLRFDKIGCLFRTDDGILHIEPSDPEGDGVTYTSGIDEMLAAANARLQEIENEQYGAAHNISDYTRHWFMRSLIPSFYDDSLDAKGFPLWHGDFHSQNILVVDVERHPRITAIIDWDNTKTICTSSFAQYPLFIVDNPLWDDTDDKVALLRQRNVRDQATFIRLFEEAECKKFPDSGARLFRAFANCKGVYLLEQCIPDQITCEFLFRQLVRHVFGVSTSDEWWFDYTDGLEDNLLHDVMKKLTEEDEVVDEAREVLGDDKVPVTGLSRKDFIEVARKHEKDFPAEGKVLPWLNKVVAGL